MPLSGLPIHCASPAGTSPLLDVRRLSLLLGWFGVLVVALGGVLLYLAGGMYIGILVVLVAVMGAAGLIASHLSRT
jgi:hypothetical protein